jgi:hypothetical protein
VVALCLVSAAAAGVTGDKWEGTWRVGPGTFAGSFVLRPATDAGTRAHAPACAGAKRVFYMGAYSGRRAGTVAACGSGYGLAGRLYEGGKRVGDFSITWELSVSPDGTVGAPTFRGRYSVGGSAGSWSGMWLRHGGTIPSSKAGGGAPTSQGQAVARVEAILRKNKAKCQMTWTKIVARGSGTRWTVTASVSTFGNPGQASWNIVGTRMAPADQLASEIEVGCP